MTDQLVARPQTNGRTPPKTVESAKIVEIALVRYTDETGLTRTCLAVVGDNNVHLLDGKPMGFSTTPTPQGHAVEWMRNGIFEALGKEIPGKQEESEG